MPEPPPPGASSDRANGRWSPGELQRGKGLISGGARQSARPSSVVDFAEASGFRDVWLPRVEGVRNGLVDNSADPLAAAQDWRASAPGRTIPLRASRHLQRP